MLLIVILVLAVPGNSQNHPCTKYSVKLVRSSYARRLQICWSDGERLQWYSVCSVLNDDAAAAVCGPLGINSPGNQGTFGIGLHSSF